MKHAIKAHLRDFLSIAALVSLAVGVGAYVLENQRVRFPLVEDEPFEVWVELENARGVMPGQGQTVRVAGTRVGDVAEVALRDGRALVRMDLDPHYDDLVRRGASVLLRPRTGLKDMFLELDPGPSSAPAVEEGAVIPAANTAADVNPDEILEMLDSDTRAYLKLLINGLGKGLARRGGDLREVFARLGPLHRDLDRLNSEVVKRRRNLARLVHNYGSTMSRLGREDDALAGLVRDVDRVFDRLALEDQRISLAVERLPSALTQAARTLRKVRQLGESALPAFRALRPAIRRLEPANRELRPLAETAEPVVREQVRPFVRLARPYVADLLPAARDLGKASPDLRESVFELNRFLNIAAHNPNGAEPLPSDLASALERDEGFLYWLGWAAHNANASLQTADAQGPFRRATIAATCATWEQLVESYGAAAALVEDALGLTQLLSDAELCPP